VRWLLGCSAILSGLMLAPALADSNVNQAGDATKKAPTAVNGLEFKLIVDKVWSAPGAGKESDIKLAVEITNVGKEAKNVSYFQSCEILLKNEDGFVFPKAGGGGSGTPNKLKAWAEVLPGKSMTIPFSAKLRYVNYDYDFVYIERGRQGAWLFKGFTKETYQMHIVYENTRVALEGDDYVKFWTGKAETQVETVVIK